MSDSTSSPKCCANLSAAYAHLLLRLWIGMRLFMAGVDKFRSGNGENATFNFDNLTKKSGLIADLMSNNSFLPKSMCGPFANFIVWPLLVVGVWVVVGIFTELGLFAAGLVFLMLGFGLAALPDDGELVGNIGISIGLVALALMTSHAKKFSIDGFCRGKKKCTTAE
jgi:uncharacterized membrane protein YphA (DoxX/SURF4 family)